MNGYNEQNDRYEQSNNNQNQQYSHYEQARRPTSYNSRIGDYSNFIMLGGVLLGAHVFGVSPWNLMMLVNMLRGGGGMYVGGMGGMGGLGGRRRQRGGFGWF